MNYQQVIEKLEPFQKLLSAVPKDVQDRVTDIKLSVHKPVMLFCANKLCYPLQNGLVTDRYSPQCRIVQPQELEAVFYRLCGYSVYSHLDEIRSGYIAVDRALRVGLSGTAVTENGTLKTVREITGLCVRIPRQIIGCAQGLLAKGVRPEKGVLIAGAPSSGKTTLLRDLARVLGNSGHRTVLLDERYELLGDGFDVGVCTDVLQGYPKKAGYAHAVRCLSPEYIFCDELSEDDLPAVKQAAFSGIAFAATVHAGSLDELRKRPLCRELLQSGVFTYIVLLTRNKHTEKDIKIFKVGDVLENVVDLPDRAVRSCDRLG